MPPASNLTLLKSEPSTNSDRGFKLLFHGILITRIAGSEPLFHGILITRIAGSELLISEFRYIIVP